MRPVRVTLKRYEHKPGHMKGELELYVWSSLTSLAEANANSASLVKLISRVTPSPSAHAAMHERFKFEISDTQLRFVPSDGKTTIPSVLNNKSLNDSVSNFVRAFFAAKENKQSPFVWVSLDE
jgi:hypothetical protein